MVTLSRLVRRGAAALALSAVCLGGCELLPKSPPDGKPTPPEPPPEESVKVGPHEAAAVKAEFARMLEKRGEAGPALTAYTEATKQDPANVEALLGAARLLDAQGRFAESADYYHKAHEAQPRSAKVACNQGYSLYLQGRFADAEKALRLAISLEPDNGPAHTDLGLVLAHAGKSAEALAEFRRAGCDDADAHVNLAFALTLKKAWPEARREYETALAIDPASAAAKKGLQGLEAVMAKAAEAPAE